MNDFSQNASTFNCGLIAFEKFDMGWVQPVRFPWQQQHHSRRQLYEQNAFDWRRLDFFNQKSLILKAMVLKS